MAASRPSAFEGTLAESVTGLSKCSFTALSSPVYPSPPPQTPSTGRSHQRFYDWFCFSCTSSFFFPVWFCGGVCLFFHTKPIFPTLMFTCESSLSFAKQIWECKEVVFLVSSCDHTNIYSLFTHCWGSVPCRRGRWTTVEISWISKLKAGSKQPDIQPWLWNNVFTTILFS